MAKHHYKLDEIVFAKKSTHGLFKDLEGQNFGRLKVLGLAENRGKKHWYWYCLCKCGKIIKACSTNLRKKHTNSCGCFQKENACHKALTHGGTGTVEYRIYSGIKARCENPNVKRYPDYGGRGLTLSLSFEEFIKEVGARPETSFSIERINNNSGYGKGNIRWATRIEQANNKRNNKFITFEGKTKSIARWEKEMNVPRGRFRGRKIKLGWCDFHSLTLPVGSQRVEDCPDCNHSSDEIAFVIEGHPIVA